MSQPGTLKSGALWWAGCALLTVLTLLTGCIPAVLTLYHPTKGFEKHQQPNCMHEPLAGVHQFGPVRQAVDIWKVRSGQALLRISLSAVDKKRFSVDVTHLKLLVRDAETGEVLQGQAADQRYALRYQPNPYMRSVAGGASGRSTDFAEFSFTLPARGRIGVSLSGLQVNSVELPGIVAEFELRSELSGIPINC